MDQWKLVLQALFLTLFLPLLLWTGLFAFFGWKLFLFLFAGIGLLFMFGDKLIQHPMFQSVVRMLLPFAMTLRFYAALKAGQDVREQEGSSTQAWWATFRHLLKQPKPDDEQKVLEENKKPRKTKPDKRRLRQHKLDKEPTASQTTEPGSEFDRAPASPSIQQELLQQAARTRRPSEQEVESMLAELKAKMEREKEKE